ncbi:glycosyltransferase [Lyngbya sp. PCC 8106]|uniref:glycosyltransferase n=1 Tax=Lyngbya sp. (strain PCC 8106) TaxID=313612 RepID=UPI0000EAA14D|nr:glycosyltransferase [Lyngbya sp. PCC 8106]EAW38121.1 Predicted glycosyltransferase [Lyngbya sp. PCC 8106]
MIYWITVNYYSTSLIEQLINSIPVQSDINYRVIIVNNSPDDSSIYAFKNESIIILDSPENIGFGQACNLGLNWVYQQNHQGIVWLINPDAYLPKDSLKQVIEFFQSYPDLSILGTVVEEPTGKVWFGGGEFNAKTGQIIALDAIAENPESNLPYITMKWVTGCSLLINLKKFSECPQFDSDYFLYYEDFDFCMRYGKQGHSVVMSSQIRVTHQPSSITNRNQPLKIQQSIYSYLLSLEKHTNFWVLGYRLLRITLVSLVSLLISSQVSDHKLRGVWLYCQRLHPVKIISKQIKNN